MSNRPSDFCPACGTKTEQRPVDGRIRPACPACGQVIYFDPKAAAVCFITRHDHNEALLIQRGVMPGQGLWALAGGYIELDEHPQQAAQREALEETGLEVEIVSLLDVFYSLNDGGVITIAYLARVCGGELQHGDDAQALGWFHVDDPLPELVFASTHALVGRWRRGEL